MKRSIRRHRSIDNSLIRCSDNRLLRSDRKPTSIDGSSPLFRRGSASLPAPFVCLPRMVSVIENYEVDANRELFAACGTKELLQAMQPFCDAQGKEFISLRRERVVS